MAEDQRAFVAQSRDLLSWLGELPLVTAADEDELRAMRLEVDEHWMDWLPLEADGLFDQIVALYCDSCAAGRLDLNSPASIAVKHALFAFASPKKNPCAPRSRQRLPDHVKLDTLVWDIVRLYDDSREIRAWRKAFVAALGEDIVRRLSSPAFDSLYERLEARRDALREVAHELPPVKQAKLPDAYDALAHAQYAVQPIADRFAAYADLLSSFATLYKTKGGLDADEVDQAARQARTPVALQHFAALGSRQPEYLSHVRDELFLACDRHHSMAGYLPPSRPILRRVLQPLLDANAPLLRQSTEMSSRTPPSEHEVIDLCTPPSSTSTSTRAHSVSAVERRRNKEEKRASAAAGRGRHGS
ncbi:hypothetical protein JCM8208_005810 [Rhodotorula glutinis]